MANRDHSLDDGIIQAAYSEFLAYGFQKASLHKIAEKAELEMPKQTTSSKRGITEMVSPGKETGKQMAQESQETEQHTSLRR